jgi:hypothetical protein
MIHPRKSQKMMNGDIKVTHDELLEVINVYNDGKGDSFANALRAVVELHNPVDVSWKNDGSKVLCSSCQEGSDLYPCPTIQAIEKELK